MTGSWFKRWFSTPTRQAGSSLQRSLLLCAYLLLALAALYGHLVLWPQDYREGRVLPYTVFAPVTFVYEDSQKLAELTGSVGDGEALKVIDNAAVGAAAGELQAFQEQFRELRQRLIKDELDDAETNALISALAQAFQLDPLVVSNLLHFQDDQLERVLSMAHVLLAQEMNTPVTEAKIRTLKQGGTPELVRTPENIYIYFLRPNLADLTPPNITNERRALARVTVQKGSVIIPEGGTVDRRIAEQLEELRPHLLEQNLYRYLGLVLILFIATFLFYQYLFRYAPQLLARTGIVAQMGGLFLIFLIVGLLIGRLPFNYLYYGVTFAVATMATAVVLVYDTRFALYLALGLGLVLSIALNFGAGLMLYTIGGALLPTTFLKPGCPRRTQVLFAFALGLYNVLLAGAVILVSVQTLHWQVFAIAFSAGFVAAVLSLGLLPVIETFTAQLTPGKLIELANPENELLKRLKREAHGTYAHSQMVADLAEEACKDIGAEWLLARVGALYHDIGKLKRPGFFAENIHDLNKNPHQGLPPETSVKILKDHVTDGLAMAAEAHLPRELHRFIAEHHGTYIIKYFYYKALEAPETEAGNQEPVKREDYSYGGPIPQSRESGVVMLADLTEAIIRARTEADTEEIAAIISQIISEKIDEHQLVDSELTLGDLAGIKEAFVRILTALRHHRVRYPGQAPAPMQFHFVGQDITESSAAAGPQATDRQD